MALTGKTTKTTNSRIVNDGFWPSVMVDELMSQYRIPSEYADDTIETGLVLSIIQINEALLLVKRFLESSDYVSLADYCDDNPDPVNDIHVLITQYKAAVFMRAKAFLLQQFNSMNRRSNAENAAKESQETKEYWLDQSQAAVAFIFNRLLPEQKPGSVAGFHAALI